MHQDIGEPRLAQPARHAWRHPLAGRERDLSGAGVAQVARELALEVVGIERRHPALLAVAEGDRPVEPGEDLLLRHPRGFAGLQRPALGLALGAQLVGGGIVERHQQGRRRQFAPPVDAHIHVVLGVELEIEP